MEKVKCLIRNIEEEISDAWKYADRAVTWDREGHHEAASIFAAMAKSELEHASMNERILELVSDGFSEHPEKHAAVDMLLDVVEERIEKANEDVREMLGRLGK